MKKGTLLLIILFGWGCELYSQPNHSDGISSVCSDFKNPIGEGADPWIVKEDGIYYGCYSTGREIVVTKSRFITKAEQSRVVWKCRDSAWNAHNIWAPELHFIDGKWYIYYAGGSMPNPPYIHQRTGVLEADHPMDDYRDMGIIYTGDCENGSTKNIWAIDMTVFKHNKQYYAIWSGWEKQTESDKIGQHLYIAPMLSPTRLGKRILLSKADKEWESGDDFNLLEGPEVLQHQNQTFIIYSTRGSWTIHYKLGMLQLKSKDSNPLDSLSWQKHGPVFQGNDQVYGVGHACFTTSPDDTEHWIVYHSKKRKEGGWERDIRTQKFSFDCNGMPIFGKPVVAGEKQERPSGEKEIELKQKNRKP